MAKEVLSAAHLTLGGVDLSDHVKSVTLTYEADALDSTAMGDTTKLNLAGLKNWSVEAELFQDYASGSVDATLFSLVGTNVAIAIRKSTSAKSGTNPEFTCTGVLTSYQPVGGTVGEVHMTSVSFSPASALTRATS